MSSFLSGRGGCNSVYGDIGSLVMCGECGVQCIVSEV